MNNNQGSLPPNAYLALKAAVRRLSKAAGGVESASFVCRLDHSRIARCGNPNEAMHLPIDVVAALEDDVNDPIVTRALADITGHVLIKKPDAASQSQWIEKIGALGKECGEALAGLSAAFATDGEITAQEIHDQDLRGEVRQAMEALSAVDAKLKNISEGERK